MLCSASDADFPNHLMGINGEHQTLRGPEERALRDSSSDGSTVQEDFAQRQPGYQLQLQHHDIELHHTVTANQLDHDGASASGIAKSKTFPKRRMKRGRRRKNQKAVNTLASAPGAYLEGAFERSEPSIDQDPASGVNQTHQDGSLVDSLRINETQSSMLLAHNGPVHTPAQLKKIAELKEARKRKLDSEEELVRNGTHPGYSQASERHTLRMSIMKKRNEIRLDNIVNKHEAELMRIDKELEDQVQQSQKDLIDSLTEKISKLKSDFVQTRSASNFDEFREKWKETIFIPEYPDPSELIAAEQLSRWSSSGMNGSPGRSIHGASALARSRTGLQRQDIRLIMSDRLRARAEKLNERLGPFEPDEWPSEWGRAGRGRRGRGRGRGGGRVPVMQAPLKEASWKWTVFKPKSSPTSTGTVSSSSSKFSKVLVPVQHVAEAAESLRTPYDDIACTVCGKGDNESELLMCDTCNRGTHLSCCDPIQTYMPGDDELWFCSLHCSEQHKMRFQQDTATERSASLSPVIAPAATPYSPYMYPQHPIPKPPAQKGYVRSYATISPAGISTYQAVPIEQNMVVTFATAHGPFDVVLHDRGANPSPFLGGVYTQDSAKWLKTVQGYHVPRYFIGGVGPYLPSQLPTTVRDQLPVIKHSESFMSAKTTEFDGLSVDLMQFDSGHPQSRLC
ncbi:hypothetical protein BJ742DRAFT_838152 [Cladochytrium replicatum]|nr:hypothetical protein BJ742DRAFT_838152 [Cladochytrium replicatum]